MQTLLQSVTICDLTGTNQEHFSAVQHVTFWPHPTVEIMDPTVEIIDPTSEISH